MICVRVVQLRGLRVAIRRLTLVVCDGVDPLACCGVALCVQSMTFDR
jgi:hypothetical protein